MSCAFVGALPTDFTSVLISATWVCTSRVVVVVVVVVSVSVVSSPVADPPKDPDSVPAVELAVELGVELGGVTLPGVSVVSSEVSDPSKDPDPLALCASATHALPQSTSSTANTLDFIFALQLLLVWRPQLSSY
jgi:hypothetical protein